MVSSSSPCLFPHSSLDRAEVAHRTPALPCCWTGLHLMWEKLVLSGSRTWAHQEEIAFPQSRPIWLFLPNRCTTRKTDWWDGARSLKVNWNASLPCVKNKACFFEPHTLSRVHIQFSSAMIILGYTMSHMRKRFMGTIFQSHSSSELLSFPIESNVRGHLKSDAI